MDSVTIFWMQLLVSCVVCAIVVAWHVWPYLTKLSRHSALIPLLFVHVFRYVGMTLLVAGMIDPKLPREFLSSAAYGDLLAAALALASIFALRSDWRFAVALVWVTNIWGFADLLNGVRGVLQLNVPSFNLGSIWYIYTFYAPVVIASHLMIFRILIRSKSWKGKVSGSIENSFIGPYMRLHAHELCRYSQSHAAEPSWFDESAAPRYGSFEPDAMARFYARGAVPMRP